MKYIDGIPVWGDPDEATVNQIKACVASEEAAGGGLMADGHKGYSMPIGGVVAYRNAISPSGVGYDIGCGIKAVRVGAQAADVRRDLGGILDEIARQVAFGLGRANANPLDHPLFDDYLWKIDKNLASLKGRAHAQLGTVGSGNHFVDLLEEPKTGALWVAAHFGSRGFGHGVASGFLNLAHGREFDERAPGETMDDPPTVIPMDGYLGQAYWAALTLVGQYAYAGRDYVVDQVVRILGVPIIDTVHNHHNFAWLEEHGGEKLYVVRKGATPAWPGQRGFVGGSMGDWAAIVEGVDTEEAALAYHSTVHGAGRIMSRTAARGKHKKGVEKKPGLITRQMMSERTKAFGVVVRGGDVDESPHVYRDLRDVIEQHAGNLQVRHWLRPIGVVMAGADVADPYKD